MKVLRKPKTPLERQILEGVLIEEEKLEEILNSKSEYGHNVVPRVRIEVGARVMRDDELVEYRRQKVREEFEEDLEWERKEQGKLAGKRDGERIEASTAKRVRVEEVSEERVIEGVVVKEVEAMKGTGTEERHVEGDQDQLGQKGISSAGEDLPSNQSQRLENVKEEEINGASRREKEINDASRREKGGSPI